VESKVLGLKSNAVPPKCNIVEISESASDGAEIQYRATVLELPDRPVERRAPLVGRVV
jgi:hypothetical protein